MSKHTPEDLGFGTGPCGPFLDYQAHGDERPGGMSDFDGRLPIWLGGEVDPEDQERIAMRYNALSGIASAAPGSVAKLVEAADKAKEQLAYMLSQQHEGSEFYAGCGSECHTRVTELLTALAAITLEGGE